MSEDKLSPIHDEHLALGAKMADFSGWLMPIEYAGGGVLTEHAAVREHVGIFDVSHLGNATVKGQGAFDFVNSCFTNDLRKIGPGKAQYTMCCNESGGVVDDLIQYVRAEDDILLIPNAANTSEVVRLLSEAAPEGITVTNEHTDYAIIAVQGPDSPKVLTAMGLPTDMEYMSFEQAEHNGIPMTVCRTGYTGEKGYELVCPWDKGADLWRELLKAIEPFNGRPCGLGARDTLRMEMGYALHGHELNLDITPNMARAVWAIGWDKPAFWGKDFLTTQRAEKKARLSWGLLVQDKGIPRQDCEILDADGNVIGVVTSGTMSPSLKQGIALGLIDRGIKAGDEVFIAVRNRKLKAIVQRPPFVETGVAD
ncbi:glycine cleavage system aminomethyltransferase GcvT [Dermatophilus congolensis]|uniref:aminomethyltransferase n=1 Tax=Dermatophilus congolensis TaxID=1863 RepID=A0A239VMH7_9MICO|nr:glycine cleavage system aminomethyltransferase GcvT [Dermatophilus congolensis]MBO3129535.1 glycine cleavage system aminomethyltransferase GcvT [Dermatophilus congolensis]MBO3131830.1 glycine cleavage system aminomethyltransferase GcvT [Dermatophilus congolensis]MBO3134013.1 glycine cleavage system aminomethyltransferase GcvT [Dermatophilus congolensis]MBO3136244.1 glycine cleavage system aminomethyltransferase GcvT [Dermatophilus congolensis]MBO3138490.1 glycine cleavage system aminomethyl